MEKTLKNKIGMPLLAAAMVAGMGLGALGVANAQSANAADTTAAVTTTAGTAQTAATVDTTGTTDPTDATTAAHPRGHAPQGGDGIVASISGTTVTMTEEADEGGATYTIDASGATVSKDGASATLSSIAVGDKIFVKGTVTGTNVVATSINDGHGGHGGPQDAVGN